MLQDTLELSPGQKQVSVEEKEKLFFIYNVNVDTEGLKRHFGEMDFSDCLCRLSLING